MHNTTTTDTAIELSAVRQIMVNYPSVLVAAWTVALLATFDTVYALNPECTTASCTGDRCALTTTGLCTPTMSERFVAQIFFKV